MAGTSGPGRDDCLGASRNTEHMNDMDDEEVMAKTLASAPSSDSIITANVKLWRAHCILKR
ncbi:hypothetical protein AC578_7714 [Pseudocercospora eumusae]|uniref:Uncharacterized protein n=1 Tax=Pseudocercospora eumusae TaxID=321146 RepID=A0A139HL08_9PEZI|nr:hypothetical protein AC578_7714 [Pseudocercospora eumusae]